MIQFVEDEKKLILCCCLCSQEVTRTNLPEDSELNFWADSSDISSDESEVEIPRKVCYNCHLKPFVFFTYGF